MAGSEKKAGNTRNSKRLRASGPPTRFEAGGISKMDLVKKGKAGKDAQKNATPATKWTVAEVSDWISSFAFGKQYKDAFAEHEIAGDTLNDIDDQILTDELGIENPKHRKRLIAEIKDVLRKDAAAQGGGKANRHAGGSDSDSDSDSDSEDDSSSDSSDSSDSDEEKPVAKKSKENKNDAFNFPSDDDEADEKSAGVNGKKKLNATKKRSSNASQSSSGSAAKKRAPTKTSTKKGGASKSNGTVRGGKTGRKSTAAAAGAAKSKKSRRGSAKKSGGGGGAFSDIDVPPGKMVCPSCGAVIDKGNAMCMKCFTVFPEKKSHQFEATSYYRAYRAVPNYRT